MARCVGGGLKKKRHLGKVNRMKKITWMMVLVALVGVSVAGCAAEMGAPDGDKAQGNDAASEGVESETGNSCTPNCTLDGGFVLGGVWSGPEESKVCVACRGSQIVQETGCGSCFLADGTEGYRPEGNPDGCIACQGDVDNIAVGSTNSGG